MTKNEYAELYVQARKSLPYITIRTMREIRTTYKDAAKLAADAMRAAEKSGAAEITVQSYRNLYDQLTAGAAKIEDIIRSETPGAVEKLAAKITDIDYKFTKQAFDTYNIIDPAKIKSLGLSINSEMVNLLQNRIWQDGYTFSHRVWRVGVEYQTQIKRVVSAGLAQGRDPVSIAGDIEVYVAEGKAKLAKRYGPDLEQGTKEWLKRIRKNIDYNAMRLVRTELYATLQDAGRESGRVNPAALDQYDWILEANRQHWNCACPDLADGSWYAYNDVPSMPHPNCRCRVQARLRNDADFQGDIKAWVDGNRVPYLDEWYNEIYLSVG